VVEVVVLLVAAVVPVVLEAELHFQLPQEPNTPLQLVAVVLEELALYQATVVPVQIPYLAPLPLTVVAAAEQEIVQMALTVVPVAAAAVAVLLERAVLVTLLLHRQAKAVMAAMVL
jgi:hypothetical protein